jgi:hypothetical protein
MGYLYLIKCNEFYKIGIGADVGDRIAQLQTGNPYELVCEVAYNFGNPLIVERVLHERFTDRQVRGEWYQLNGVDLDLFNQICALLGGEKHENITPTDEDVEDASEVDAVGGFDDQEFDRMIADGWRVEVFKGGRYFQWRKGSRQKLSKYGGKFEDLPAERQAAYMDRVAQKSL